MNSTNVVDRGAQAGVQTVACGEATLSQQENTWQMSTKNTSFIGTEAR
jgi:hypothetical protein